VFVRIAKAENSFAGKDEIGKTALLTSIPISFLWPPTETHQLPATNSLDLFFPALLKHEMSAGQRSAAKRL